MKYIAVLLQFYCTTSPIAGHCFSFLLCPRSKTLACKDRWSVVVSIDVCVHHFAKSRVRRTAARIGKCLHFSWSIFARVFIHVSIHEAPYQRFCWYLPLIQPTAIPHCCVTAASVWSTEMDFRLYCCFNLSFFSSLKRLDIRFSSCVKEVPVRKKLSLYLETWAINASPFTVP